MAEIVWDVMELIGPPAPGEDDDMLVVFSPEAPQVELSAGFRKLWGMVLCMAVRDQATSIHYHPWQADWSLTYVCECKRYAMVPPPDEYAAGIVAEARAAFTRPPGFFARLFGRDPVACGTLRLIVGAPVLWDVVCWSTGPRFGVDFFLVTPVGKVELD